MNDLVEISCTSSNGETNSEQKLEQQYTYFLILISILTLFICLSY